MESLYKPLNDGEIRLLTVSFHDGVISALELQTYSRDKTPEYDAVSYTWGDELSTVPVCCNGFHLEIRMNLFTALPYIDEFRPSPRRPLWVDAICLDQDNDFEKAAQVPFMGTIYENATRTVIWLGEAANESDLAIDSMGSLTQKMLSVDPSLAHLFLQHHVDLGWLGLPAEYDPVWKSFQAIQLRSWYFRLWTLQEVVLAKEVIMLCGNMTMSWDAVMMLQRAATRANLTSLVLPVEWDQSGMPGDLSTTITFTHGLRTQLSRQPKPMLLPTAIQFTMNRKYTEPVDRIWAILGLLDKRNREVCVKASLVDYTPAARLDYHKTYLGMMRLYIDLNPVVAMMLLEVGLAQVHNPKLPSWCPDWHLDRTCTPFSYMGGVAAGSPDPTFQGILPTAVLSSGRFRPDMSIGEDSVIKIPGLALEIVQTASSSVGIFWGSYLDWRGRLDTIRLAQSYNWMRQCLDIFNATHGTDVDVMHAVPGGRVPDPVLYSYQMLHDCMTWLKTLLHFDDDTIDIYSVRSWCSGRKFFRTEAGKFGLGPPDLDAGDVICALFAGTPLFVLRRVECQGQLQQRYHVIGDAYIPDLMHGEGFKGKDWDLMQSFCLV